MKRILQDIFGGFVSLLTGMRITLQQFFKKDVTVRYPHESLKMAKRFRGHVILLRDPVTGQSLCVACKSCAKACPSDCIVVDGLKREGEKKKSVTEFQLDFTRCSLCGSCVEVCPSDALGFSKDYNLAGTDKSAFVHIDLVKRMEDEAKAAPEEEKDGPGEVKGCTTKKSVMEGAAPSAPSDGCDGAQPSMGSQQFRRAPEVKP